jgi:hypothetical protein
MRGRGAPQAKIEIGILPVPYFAMKKITIEHGHYRRATPPHIEQLNATIHIDIICRKYLF